MSNKYVKVDDIMNLINTNNRGNCDYFIVDKIEELCNSDKTYNIDKVVEELEEMKYKTIPIMSGKDTVYARIYDRNTINESIEIVKRGGVNDR